MNLRRHEILRTARLLIIGALSGALAAFPIVFTMFALSGRVAGIGVPAVWLVTGVMGAVIGGLALPVLGWTVLARVPPGRIVVVLSAGMWVGTAIFTLLRSSVLGAFVGFVFSILWLALKGMRQDPRAAREVRA